MDLDAYRNAFEDDGAPGWDAIDGALEKVYPARAPDFHFGTVIKHLLGGPDPLDGISLYRRPEAATPHLHIVTYGMSELYFDEDAFGGDESGWGFEFTLRLGAEGGVPIQSEDEAPIWALQLLQGLARYVFETGKIFEPDQFIDLRRPIRPESDTPLTGFLVTEDPELPPIETPHGEVAFRQLVGATAEEIAAVSARRADVPTLLARKRALDPLLVTELWPARR